MREQSTQRLLKLTSLVTFLFSDKKVTFLCLGKRSFICNNKQKGDGFLSISFFFIVLCFRV